MTRGARARYLAGFVVAIAISCRRARRVGREPRPVPSARRPRPRRGRIDPFRVAADAPAPTAPAATPPRPPRRRPRRPPRPRVCQKDEDCPEKNICEAGSCQPIKTRTNILFLYYKEESFTEILLVYWYKKGPQGYTVLFPFYWHFWGPKSETTRDRPGAPGLLVQGARLLVIRGLAVLLRLQQVRLGGAAARHVQDRRSRQPQQLRRGRCSSTGGSAPPRTRSTSRSPLFVSTRRPREELHLGASAQLLLADRQRPQPAGAAALLRELVPHRRHLRHLARLQTPQRPQPQRLAALALLGRRQRRGQDRVRRPVPAALVVPQQERALDRLLPVPVGLPERLVAHDGDGPVPGDRGRTVLLRGGIPVLVERRQPSRGARVPDIHPDLLLEAGRQGQDGLPADAGRRRTAATTRPAPRPGSRSRSSCRTATRRPTPASSAPSTSATGRSPSSRSPGSSRCSTGARIPKGRRPRSSRCSGASTTPSPTPARRCCCRSSSGGRGRATPPPSSAPSTGAASRTAAGARGSSRSPISARTRAAATPSSSRSTGSTPTRARERNHAVAPLFWWHRDRHGYSGGLPAAASSSATTTASSWAVQFPLLFHFASAHDGTSATITPLGYYGRDSDGWSLGRGPLIPLFFARSGEKRSHFALIPLIWHFRDRDADRTTTVVVLYMHRRWGNETTDALFPLIYYRRGARPGGGEETSFTLFPLVHYRRNANIRVLVTPLGGAARGPNRAAGFIGPYFWYEDKAIAVRFIPLLHADITNRVTGERTRQYGPWFQTDAPDHWSRAFFPVFGVYQDNASATPGCSRRSSACAATTAIGSTPSCRSIGGRRSAARTTTVVGLYYDRTAPGIHNNGLFPIFFHARNPERTFTVIPPLLFARRAQADGSRTGPGASSTTRGTRATSGAPRCSRSTGRRAPDETAPGRLPVLLALRERRAAHELHAARAADSSTTGKGRPGACCRSPGSPGTATPATSRTCSCRSSTRAADATSSRC